MYNVLCLISSFRLKYVKSAKASTDVPTTIAEFISQRRRWLNGSLFAALHATVYMMRIWTSGQSFFRKIILQFEFIYNAVQLFFTWTALANFYLAFYFVSLLSLSTSELYSSYSFSSFNPPVTRLMDPLRLWALPMLDRLSLKFCSRWDSSIPDTTACSHLRHPALHCRTVCCHCLLARQSSPRLKVHIRCCNDIVRYLQCGDTLVCCLHRLGRRAQDRCRMEKLWSSDQHRCCLP